MKQEIHKMQQEHDIAVQLADLAATIAGSLGLSLYDVDYRRSGSRCKVVLFVDRIDGAVSLDDCERFSRQISRELDVLDLIPMAYDLEVSSPGLDRRIRTREHWIRATGERAQLKFRDSQGTSRSVLVTVLGLRDDEVLVRGPDGVEFSIEIAAVQSAHAHVDW